MARLRMLPVLAPPVLLLALLLLLPRGASGHNRGLAGKACVV
jgi:hypothetical protein